MFKVNKKNNSLVSHTVRFDEKLYAELYAISIKKGISFNSLIIQCCQYALNNLEIEVTQDNT